MNTASLAAFTAAVPDSTSASSNCAILDEDSVVPSSATKTSGDEGKRERRVSFNLKENTVVQFPSNATLGKIALACSKRRSSLVEWTSTLPDKSQAELAVIADRKAQALLPSGASTELFHVGDGFALTALYVKRGHIRLLEHNHMYNSTLPVKGVLKQAVSAGEANVHWAVQGEEGGMAASGGRSRHGKSVNKKKRKAMKSGGRGRMASALAVPISVRSQV
ncbi:hypothetical protein GGI02_002698 [Coemansia sp. RSA 2322]|nr:hypothetical protein GGI02_002698 [Coemansia sp. RSA 2322]